MIKTVKKRLCFLAFLLPSISHAEVFGPAIHHIEMAGSTVTARDTLNFVSGATVIDNVTSTRTDITISGGSSITGNPADVVYLTNSTGTAKGDNNFQYDSSVSSVTLAGDFLTGTTIYIHNSSSTITSFAGWNSKGGLNLRASGYHNFYFGEDQNGESGFSNSTPFLLAPIDIRLNSPFSSLIANFKTNNTTGQYIYGLNSGNAISTVWSTPDSGNTVWWSMYNKPLTGNNEFVRFESSATVGAIFKLFGSGFGANSVGFKAPNSPATNVVWELPGADGTNGQALVTNGNKVLSFTTISSGSSASTLAIGTGTASAFIYNASSPTAVISFLGSQFASSATTTTNFVSLNPSSVTLPGSIFARDATITGAGFVGTDLLSLHVPSQSPYLGALYNDTFSSSSPEFRYFGWNNGVFEQGTDGNTEMQFMTGGFSKARVAISSSGIMGIGGILAGTPTSALGGMMLRVAPEAAATTGIVIVSTINQTGDLLDMKASDNTHLLEFDSVGAIRFSPTTDTSVPTTYSAIKNYSSGNLLLVTAAAKNMYFNVGVPTILTLAAAGNAALVNTGVSTSKGLILQGVASQTGNMLEIQDNSGNIFSSATVRGGFFASTFTSTNGGYRFPDGTVQTTAASAGSVTLVATQTWSGQNKWTTPAVSSFTYGVTVGSITVGSGGVNSSGSVAAAGFGTVSGSYSSGSGVNAMSIGTNNIIIAMSNNGLIPMQIVDSQARPSTRAAHNVSLYRYTPADESSAFSGGAYFGLLESTATTPVRKAWATIGAGNTNLDTGATDYVTVDVSTSGANIGNVGIGSLPTANRLSVVGFIATATDTAHPVPTLSSCGTGSSLSVGATDTSGQITFAGIGTSCQLVFGSGKSRAPACVVNSNLAIANETVATTTGGFTVGSTAALTSDVLSYICFGNE